MLHSSFLMLPSNVISTRIFGVKTVRSFRTFDIGGDKLLPYFEQRRKSSDGLAGNADRPGPTAYALPSLRALIEAASGRELHICFLWSVRWPSLTPRASWFTANANGKERGTSAYGTQGGAMLEVPSLYFQLSALSNASFCRSVQTIC